MNKLIVNTLGFLNYVFKGYYVPPEIENTSEKIIMHCSDTPSYVYTSLLRLIMTLKPEVIIHTGDLVDDVKLEFSPEMLTHYKNKAVSFLNALEKTGTEKIYVVPGNHDDQKILKKSNKSVSVVSCGSVVNYKDFRIGVAHNLKDLPCSADYSLYGHKLEEGEASPFILNGVNNINIILYPSKRLYRLPYPLGTNVERGYDFKINRLL